MHGAPECHLRPPADAGLRIGREVSRIDHAEGGRHRIAAGECLPALCRVTRRAIPATRESFALRDQFRREASGWRSHDWSNGWLPGQHAKACKPETSENDDSDEQLLEHGILQRLAMARVVH